MRDALARPAHGGDLETVAARYGARERWLDFSANINPAGPPPAVLAALRAGAGDVSSLVRYPTARDRALQTVLAETLATAPDRIVIANGAAAIIEAFVRTVAPRRCLVPQPAFSEYARALAAQGCETIPFVLDPSTGFALEAEDVVAALRRERPDACIVTNPHNPSGALAGRAALETMLDAARRLGTAVLVDEAFIDFAPEASVAGAVHNGEVLVLRSLTKFYAMPALRVGYALAPRAFAQAVAARIPSWPVTSLAADAAIAALSDDAYASETRESNACERERLRTDLRALPLTVFSSAANFLLLDSAIPSPVLTDALASRHGIVVRDCATYPTLEDGGYIRIGVRSRTDNAQLVAALAIEVPRLSPSGGPPSSPATDALR